jgi:aminoglycoside phosphotransferase (APT) family kinase protein
LAIDKDAFRRASREKPTFSIAQGAAALARHGFGALREWHEVGANPTNALYRAECSDAKIFYVKIQFRKAFSLEAQCQVTKLLRERTELPVSEICTFGGENRTFGHPYLISSELPGATGRVFFEEADDEKRLRLLREFGAVVAVIHRQQPGDERLPKRALRSWREMVREKLLDNRPLIEALPAECREKLDGIGARMDQIDAEPEEMPGGLLWGDATLHNLLVDGEGHITGVIDFENGAVGDLLVDQLHVSGDFRVRPPREIYGREEFPEAFWDEYLEAGGVRIEPGERYLKIRMVAQSAGGICWFWEALGLLHPRTLDWLDELEMGLKGLEEG